MNVSVRTRRRPVQHRVLPSHRAELCELFAVPRAGGAARGGASGAHADFEGQVVE